MPIATLPVNEWTNEESNWTKSGASPYLDNPTGNWIYITPLNQWDIKYNFSDLSDIVGNIGVIEKVELKMKAYSISNHPYYDGVVAHLWDGSSYTSLSQWLITGGYKYKTWDVTSILGTKTKIDNSGFRIIRTAWGSSPTYPIWIYQAWLEVTYSLLSTAVLERVHEVRVGYDVNNHGTLSAVNQVKWSENNPWIKIPIPAGTTIYQKIVPLQIEGEMICYNVVSIREIFYATDIQSAAGDQFAMDEDGDRNAIEYFLIKLMDIGGTTHTYSFQNVRIETINLGKAEEEYGGESPWIIKFTAEKVSKV